MINYTTKYVIDTGIDVNYKDNKGETKTNYGDENKTNYRNHDDIDLEIFHNDILLPSPQSFSHSAKNSILKDIISIVELNVI